ncbi:MAG: TIGR02452 family protein [Clostridia bacterium]|nr:TIGR02452 family protein [Clostridia bacterium]
MFDRRQKLIEVFEDTLDYTSENAQLSAAAEASCRETSIFSADAYPPLPEKRERPAVIAVTGKKSFQAASDRRHAHGEERIAVLNFASAVNPGGGVKHGSSAQEESLCRCSTLYPTLNQRFLWEAYYLPNRAAENPLHTDACIWSPDVVICKTDESLPQRLDAGEWVKVDVITCAAPNLRELPGNIHNPEAADAVRLSADEQYAIHLKRARHILHISASKRADALILGAFGCGAFANDPWAVARAYRDALTEYAQYFSYIEFAVYCRGYETENYDAFRETLLAAQA